MEKVMIVARERIYAAANVSLRNPLASWTVAAVVP